MYHSIHLKKTKIYIYFHTSIIVILFWQLLNWFVIEQNEGTLSSLFPNLIWLFISSEFILVNSIIADDVVIETDWPMLKFADNLAINLFLISDVILFKL